MVSVESGAIIGIPIVDEVLSNTPLQPEARAFFLLRICQIAQITRPDAVARCWALLRDVGNKIPLEHKAAFTGLRAIMEPPQSAKAAGFVADILTAIQAASPSGQQDERSARQSLTDIERRLTARWWPFGKRPAWAALALAWAGVDRQEALRLIGRLTPEARLTLLSSLNGSAPLTADEWDAAHRNVGTAEGVTPAVASLLDQDGAVLPLSSSLIAAVGQSLLKDMYRTIINESQVNAAEADREKALRRYVRLIACSEAAFPGIAAPMQTLATRTATTTIYKDKWQQRFSALRQIIGVWVEFPTQRVKAQAYLETELPAHLRDFALAQWHASVSNSEPEARQAWTVLKASCKDEASTEAWFLITLLRRGLVDVAMMLARESTRSATLLPRLHRAWLLTRPETAATAISAADIGSDEISQFLRLPNTTDRVEWLRHLTSNGTGPMPAMLWSRPDVLNVIRPDDANSSLLSLYKKDEPLEGQFQAYLRTHGCGQYSHEEVDPHLLEALVAWGDLYPTEAKSVLDRMWSAMQPDMSFFRVDILRNAIFERCLAVLCANPEVLNNGFVAWVKRQAVDKQVREQVGNTIYTFSLKNTVPFLYCLIGAQRVAKLSIRRADELLETALRDYAATPDLVTSAAQLYAVQKGLAVLRPPVPLKDSRHLAAWQIGVIQASMSVVVDQMAAPAAA